MTAKNRLSAIFAALVSLSAAFAQGSEVVGHFRSSLYAQAENSRDSAQKPAVIAAATKLPRSRVHKSETRFYGFISEYYDNNILNYSDSDRALFQASTSSNPRFAISSLDDYVTDLGARFTFESAGGRSARWRLRLKGDATLFGHNSFRNYTSWGVELRRNIGRCYVELNGYWLPYYNLRNLYWRPMPGRPIGAKDAAADFKRLAYGVEIGSAFSRRLDGRINIGVGSTNYKYPFDERDNTTVSETARITYDFSRRTTAYAGFGFVQSRADGRNMPVEIVRDSSYVNPVQSVPRDISYNAISAEIGARVKCDHRGRMTVAGSLDYQHQKYTSTKPLDTGHNGRIDHDYDVSLSLSWRVSDRLQPELLYQYRKSSSNVIASSTEFGSFTGYRLGAQVTGYF